MGEARNALIARAADALIAVGGEFGTLSEIALALKMGRPVVGLRTWEISGILPAGTAQEAVRAALDAAERP
jgi:predicted Rossmann-fold nucleotide-binding protein